MGQLAFCEYCLSENEYKIFEKLKVSTIKGKEIEYMSKEAVCKNCGNEIFLSNICDYNLNSLYKQYREKHNIILQSEIESILTKYSIDEEVLSLLLGWKRNTIKRYLKGDMPSDINSQIITKVYENTNYFSILLQTNKDRIEAFDYNKSRQAVYMILNNIATEDKLDSVINYIQLRCEDITPQALQKLLYYVQGFYYLFTNSFLFTEDCGATAEGPAFRSILERYKKYGFENVNKEILNNKELKLEDSERNIVESVIKFFGCYSGKILKMMTCNETPWVLSRAKVLNENDDEDNELSIIMDKKLIAEYFLGIKEEYNISNLLEIQKYSMDLFNKFSM